ncbi:MAG: DUF1934 domain-containing protein, partial [Clostridiales bacterium]|nr:DUF1934 domain-containing protein [Clostridiales bacterium]
MKENDVNINLVSTQSDGENLERTELFTRGKYKKTADGYVISYEESEATGFEGSITSLEVFGQKKVVLERTGSTESQFIIEKDKKHFCRYGTPYGDFTVGVTADEIISSLGEKGGDLKFKYVI